MRWLLAEKRCKRDFVIWKVPEAHGDRVIRIKTEGAAYPSVFCVVL